MNDRATLAQGTYAARMRGMARRSGLAGFWQWWRGELAAIMPAAPRAALARRRMRPAIVFAGERAALWLPVMEEGRPVMRLARELALADGDGRAAMSSLAAAGRAPRVVVSVPAGEVLRKRLVLPAAVEENLLQALAYDLDRHTPFKPEELYFDAVVLERDAARGTIAVDLAAARRTAVDPALRHVADWGGTVAAVVPEPPAAASTSRHNLLPPSLRTTRSPWRRVEVWIPALLVAAMALAAAAVPLWQKRQLAIDLSAQAADARARAAVSETLRSQLNARVAEYNGALERKYAYPGALQVVDTVSRILPDDTWLTQFELRTTAKGKEAQRDLSLRGETGNAGRLVQLFEESQTFTQAAQRGPTTKIQPGPGEIFDLGAQLKTQAVPAAVTLTLGEAPPPAPAAGTPPAAAPAPPAPPAGAAPPASPAGVKS